MPDTGNQKGGGMDASTFDRNSLGFEAAKLLDVLLEHVNEIGRAQVPTYALLKETGLTQGALVRARSELTRESLLRTEPGFSSSGLRGANVYVLNMTVLDPPSEELPEPGSLEGEAEEPSAGLPDPDGVMEPASTGHRKPRRRVWGKLFGSSRES